jgi:transketolase
MRTAFISELTALAATHPRIGLIVGDLGYSVVEEFAATFPERFFNAGVAEQSMVGLAAGLASEGMHPFVYSIGNFTTFRPAEQIRNDVAYHDLAVTMVAVGGGMAYGNLGYSHHAVQDFGLMRLFPGMTIASPGTPLETKETLRYLVSNPGPSYLRLGKNGEREFFGSYKEISKGGKWIFLDGSKDSSTAIVSTGGALPYALEFLKKRTEEGLDAALFTLPIWGMGFKELQSREALSYDLIYTFEDHIEDCGFGSWMKEALVSNEGQLTKRVITRALSTNVLGMVGTQDELNRKGGL